MQPGMDPCGIFSDPQRVQVLLEFCSDLRLVTLLASCPGRTWVSHQGHLGSIDPFVIHASKSATGTVSLCTQSVFPSERIGLLLRLTSITTPYTPGNVEPLGCFQRPARASSTQVQTYQGEKRSLMRVVATATNSAHAHLPSTLQQAAACVLGPPWPSNGVPQIVRASHGNPRNPAGGPTWQPRLAIHHPAGRRPIGAHATSNARDSSPSGEAAEPNLTPVPAR